MPLEFSLAHLTVLDASPLELIDIAADAGYDYVGLRLTAVTQDEFVHPLLADYQLQRRVREKLASTSVRILDFEVVRLGAEDKPESYLEMLEVAAELGASHLLCQTPDSDTNRAADNFGEICELALPFGLTVDLEFPSWTEVGSLEQATKIVEQASAGNEGILIDTLHFARSVSSVESLAELPRRWFHFAQVCDAEAEIPATEEELKHTARHERLAPGDGGIEVPNIVKAMPVIPYSLEIPNDRERARLGNLEYARRLLTATRSCLDQDASALTS